MSDRSKWFTLLDKNDAVVGEVAPEAAALLVARELADGLLDGSNLVRLRSRPPEHAGVTASVPAARTVTASGLSITSPVTFPYIGKKFTGESAEVEIAELNPDDAVLLKRALGGAGKPPSPQSNTDKTFGALDEWLMAVHEVKQAGHRLTCIMAARERVAVVFDYDADKTYSLPLKYLYANLHGVQPSTVKAWGFEHGPEELLRHVRDHNLRAYLIAGKPDYLNSEGAVDAQPDAELEALFEGDAGEVLAAFDAHTESMKNQPGFSRSQYGLR